MDIRQAKELLQRYQSGNCTDSEIELVENWYKQLNDTGEFHWNKREKDTMQKMIETRLMNQVDETPGKKVFYLKPRFIWWAAASVFFLLAGFSYFMSFQKAVPPTQVVKVLPPDVEAPQSHKAMITLANGQKIFLDSAANGALAIQGNVKLVKLANGKIVYQHDSGEESPTSAYNTLSNPRGSKVINMALADGSIVWLNAGSSLTYPVSFMGDERKVSVIGEAYFEIAQNLSKGGGKKPFIVEHNNVQVRVIGTHFNVNAFEDDGDDIKITLLEGSVKISNGSATGLLKPGQQALVNKALRIKNDVDLDFVMAWKNGYFHFDNASLQSVLKEVSRWYDVDIIFEGYNQPRQFVGEIQRDLSISEVLKILEKNKVHFKIEGKMIRVMPE
ncbi:MAG: FecR domain-containing protein [Ginsengibacter sp.]